MNPVLYHIHDPMCSWCYAYKPTLDKLREHLDKDIVFKHVVGGLAKHNEEPMPKDQREMIESIWYQIEKEVGTKFNHDFWKDCTPRRSTYLACEATMIAREYKKEDKMIEAIQEAYYKNAQNPSDLGTLCKLASNIGIDENNFKTKLINQNMDKKLHQELDFRRYLEVRVFPSLVLVHNNVKYPIKIYYNDYEKSLEQINNITNEII